MMLHKFPLQNFSDNKRGVVIIGNFDGLHKGHSRLLEQARNLSNSYDIHCYVLTFYPHPKIYLARENNKNFNNYVITKLRQKIQIFKENNIHSLYFLHFTKQVSQLSHKRFVYDILMKYINPRFVIVGYNFRFGRNREADVFDLKKLGDEQNLFETFIVDEEKDQHQQRYSSSKIRNLLQQGKVQQANQYMQYKFEIIGRVMHGFQRGRIINFPTINIGLKDYVNLKYGSYVVEVRIFDDDNIYYGIANVGIRPTFDLATPLVEANLFDFDREVYGKRVAIRFLKFLREEQKFKNIDELKKAISNDKDKAIQWLQKYDNTPT